jgi:hypothetical protein
MTNFDFSKHKLLAAHHAHKAVKRASPIAELSYLGVEFFEAHGPIFWAVVACLVVKGAQFLFFGEDLA